MPKQIKIDPDHKPLNPAPLGEAECQAGGWSQFEQWAGVQWFGDINKYTERYGPIGDENNVTSRFPIVEKESRNGQEPSPKPKSRY